MNLWLVISLLILIFVLWLIAEFFVWKAIQDYYRKVGEDAESYERQPQDLREGSWVGTAQIGPSGIFEVQEDGTVVGLAPEYDIYTRLDSEGRDDY